VFNLNMPVDSTFLSESIYEGILRYLVHGGNMKEAFQYTYQSRILTRNGTPIGILPLAGNDLSVKKGDRYEIRFPEKVLLLLNPSRISEELIKKWIDEKKTVKDLLSKDFVENISSSNYVSQFHTDFKNISIKIEKNDMSIGGDELTGPQILKVDRYTGITSLEEKYADKTITLRFSRDAMLLLLLGIYSSYIIFDKPYIYFLFFSPDEVLYILSTPKEEAERLLYSYFLIKDRTVEKVREILRGLVVNEILFLEIALSIDLQMLMSREGIDRISMILFKIAKEGNTYKIYEQLPIMIYREPPFYRVLKKYVRDPIKFCENLSRELLPNKPILRALRSFSSKNKFTEADNILRAVQGLYNFIVIGNPAGFLQFYREIYNAYNKLASKKEERADYYLRLLSRLMW